MRRLLALPFVLVLATCSNGQKPEVHASPNSDLALAANGGGCYPADDTMRSLGQIVLVNPEWAPVVDGKVVESEPALVHGTVLWMHGDTGGDFQATHTSSDYNLGLDLDPQDRWRLGSGNLSEKTPTLELEWEAAQVPSWAWAGEGDRVAAIGRWIFDCGHPDQQPRTCTVTRKIECIADGDCPMGELCDRPHYGYSTELHPPYGTAVIRQGRGQMLNDRVLPATKVDVFVSPHGGGADDKCVLAHQMDQSDTIFNVDCYPLSAPLAKINAQDFVFDVPLPARPSPNARAVWSETPHEGAGSVPAKIDVVTKEDALEVHVKLAEAVGGAMPTGYASTLIAGWDTPAATAPLVHVRVTVDAITVLDALRPAMPIVREVKSWHLQVGVNGEWQPIDIEDAEAQTTYDRGLTFDQYLPVDATLKITADGTSRACIDTLFGKSLKQTIAELGIQDAINCLETTAKAPGTILESHDGPTFGAGPGEMAYAPQTEAFVLKYRVTLIP
jgi:hypothetical protein